MIEYDFYVCLFTKVIYIKIRKQKDVFKYVSLLASLCKDHNWKIFLTWLHETSLQVLRLCVTRFTHYETYALDNSVQNK
jgi:hypothetical protein